MSTWSKVALAFAFAGVALGCDGSAPRARDAGPTATVRSAEIALRLDVPAGGPPSASVLAFRALAVGADGADVLAAVDPLVAPAPEAGRCELREVDEATRSLRAQRGQVELEELPGVAVQVGPGGEPLRPAARVFPELGSVVAGVVGEAGPADLAELPSFIGVRVPGLPDALPLPVPAAPQLRSDDGAPLGTLKVRPGEGASFTVVGPPRTFVELRPFGATVSAACPVGVGGRVVVPREVIDVLVRAGRRAPIALEAVWRESLALQTGSVPTRLSVETRAATTLEFAP